MKMHWLEILPNQLDIKDIISFLKDKCDLKDKIF